MKSLLCFQNIYLCIPKYSQSLHKEFFTISVFTYVNFSLQRGQPRWGRSLRHNDELESDDRSASSLAFESGRSRLYELHSRSCISKVEKERLSLTTPASGMKGLAQIGAWHNSHDRMPAVILVSPLLNYFNY